MVNPVVAAIFSGGMAAGLCLGLGVGMFLPRSAPKAKEKDKDSSSFVPRSFMYLAIVGAVCGVAFAYLRDPVYELRGGKDTLVAKKQTKFQRLVATKYEVARGIYDYRLFLDGFLQFSSMDEHRYHEALVHPAFMALNGVERFQDVLILGGGDGLVGREVLKHNVKSVHLVDLDPAMTELFGEEGPEELQVLNNYALSDRRMTVHNMDATHFIGNYTGDPFQVVIMDLPDPNSPILAMMYSREFFQEVMKIMHPDGVFVMQASSPFSCREAFWCIVHTVQAAVEDSGKTVRPYTVTVPSFGAQNGFVLATKNSMEQLEQQPLKVPTAYLNSQTFHHLFTIPPDETEIPTPINARINPILHNIMHRAIHRVSDS